MLKNYLKIAIRNALKHKGSSAINVIGLATGIACSILIFLFVRFELSYDAFHEKADRIHRVAVTALIGDTRIDQTYSSASTFEKLLAEFSEIETGTKILRLGTVPVAVDEVTFYESEFYAVDEVFFDIFDIPLIHGDPTTVLANPNAVVITELTALKYFGDTNVVGELITASLPRRIGVRDLEIAGVSKDVPDNSHFHYDLLVSSSTFPAAINNPNWSANNFISYIVLKKGIAKDQVERNLDDFNRRNNGSDDYDAWLAQGNYWHFYLQPITDIHLNSDLNGEFEANGNKTYVYIFSVLSVIILLIACINFMNLSTARSSMRAREVGMRKVVGSGRKQLVGQFLIESLLLSFVALACGLLLVEVLLPHYGNLIGREIDISYLDSPLVIPSLIALGLLVGVVAGSYPAFVLSSFKPAAVLKGASTGDSKRGLFLRNGLIVFQFSISVFLIIGTITIYQQLEFVQEKKLGFEKEQVLVIENPGALGANVTVFKDVLRDHGSIADVSGSNTLPGTRFSNIGFGAEGVDESFTLNIGVCDYDYLETLKLSLERGRFFSRDFRSDSSAVVLNRKAVELLGWDNPIGKKINNWSNDMGNFTVIGVVDDYHYESLHQEIRPMALFLSGGYYTSTERFVSTRLNTANVSETLAFVEETWSRFAPGMPFMYSFLNQDYEDLYINEKQTKRLFTIFSLLAIFIACLGLFGLASFVADQKAREIGIRKVLGASVEGIVGNLSMNFTKWVILANVIAWPISFFLMNAWLQNFAYRIDMSPGAFILSSVLAVAIAVSTVSYQAVKASLANPVDALKHQ